MKMYLIFPLQLQDRKATMVTDLYDNNLFAWFVWWKMYKQVENIIPKQFVYKSVTTLLTPAEAADNSVVLFFV